jgi:hypothetical protein
VARLTSDPTAPAIRLTREEGATGVLLHDELSDGLFDEINNVLDANFLLAGANPRFMLGGEVYHRVYAERQHVRQSPDRLAHLACAGLHTYAPSVYWFLALEPAVAVSIMKETAVEMKAPQIRSLARLVVLLGSEAMRWPSVVMETAWANVSQPPDYFFSFRRTCARTGPDFRYVALGIGPGTQVDLPDGRHVAAERLIENPNQAAALPTHACKAVYEGHKELRQTARYLDLFAYGAELAARASRITAILTGSL